MRALLIPQVSALSLASESDFYTHRMLVDLLTDYETSHCYMWLRSRDDGFRPSWPNVSVFPEETNWMTFYQQMSSTTGRLFELFNRISGPYPVDAVFTSRAGLVTSLMVGLSAEMEKPVPVVVCEPRIYAPGRMSHNQVTLLDAAARSLGYAFGWTVAWSESEKQEALTCVDTFLKGGLVKQAEERIRVIPYRVDVPDIENRPDGDRKLLLFSGRLNTNKKWSRILEAFQMLYETRRDVEVWVHSGTGAYAKLDPDQAKWHRTSERFADRADYRNLLRRASAGAYASLDEGSNATVQELVAVGVPMALPDRPWVRKLFDPFEYPFVWRNRRQLVGMLSWILDNEDEARAMIQPASNLIRERASQSEWEWQWRELLDQIRVENDRVRPIDRFRAEVDALLETREEVSFNVALSHSPVMKNADMVKGRWRPGRRRIFSNYAAWRAVEDLDDGMEGLAMLTGGTSVEDA